MPKQPLTRPATASENAVAVHPLPKGEGRTSRGARGLSFLGSESGFFAGSSTVDRQLSTLDFRLSTFSP